MCGRYAITLPPEAVRRSVAYVPQEAFLFSDTVAENLRIAKQDATLEEMEAVMPWAELGTLCKVAWR